MPPSWAAAALNETGPTLKALHPENPESPPRIMQARTSAPAPPRSLSRVAWLVVGAFVGSTGAWIFWGITTPGDFFGNGSSFVFPSLGLAGVLGGYSGWTAHPRRRIAFAIAALLCAAFWSRAPAGWWAKRPPQRHVVTPTSEPGVARP
jgi:hypothetical protein